MATRDPPHPATSATLLSIATTVTARTGFARDEMETRFTLTDPPLGQTTCLVRVPSAGAATAYGPAVRKL
jgi:hypothetical protein